jgi:hypothetical protein
MWEPVRSVFSPPHYMGARFLVSEKAWEYCRVKNHSFIKF